MVLHLFLSLIFNVLIIWSSERKDIPIFIYYYKYKYLTHRNKETFSKHCLLVKNYKRTKKKNGI